MIEGGDRGSAACGSTTVVIHGVRYHLVLRGRGPVVMLLHGFTGDAGGWESLASCLAPHYRTAAVDLIGHGQTDAPPEPGRYAMANCVDDLLALLDHLRAGRAAVVGYSMGGRTALHLAVRAPERITALVLEGASPGIADAGERSTRAGQDQELAAEIERHGVAAFVERWEGLPLFASQRELAAPVQARQRRRRLSQRAQGLANSLRGMGTGAQPPLWDDLPGLTMPCLLIAGERDAKYRAAAEAMARLLPRAGVEVITGAGHNTHLERPAAFNQRVLAFLSTAFPGVGE